MAIGVMQGRLSLAKGEPVQVFPWDSWQLEFQYAASLGFDCVEWLFDPRDFDINPIWTEKGRRQVQALVAESGVGVRSVCAHYFIGGQLASVEGVERAEGIEVLRALIHNAALLGAKRIVLPLMEGASIKRRAAQDLTLDSLESCLPLAAESGIQLALEADLPANLLAATLRRVGHPSLRACYDVGNATAMGEDCVMGLNWLMPWLVEVHVKDRLRQGQSQPLGQGDVDFSRFFQALGGSPFAGPLILETPVGEDPLAMASRNLRFVQSHLDQGIGG